MKHIGYTIAACDHYIQATVKHFDHKKCSLRPAQVLLYMCFAVTSRLKHGIGAG